jgi:hypothetical protein
MSNPYTIRISRTSRSPDSSSLLFSSLPFLEREISPIGESARASGLWNATNRPVGSVLSNMETSSLVIGRAAIHRPVTRSPEPWPRALSELHARARPDAIARLRVPSSDAAIQELPSRYRSPQQSSRRVSIENARLFLIRIKYIKRARRIRPSVDCGMRRTGLWAACCPTWNPVRWS